VNLRSLSTLQIALGASIAVHAVLLTVRFVDPEGFNRVFKDTPLEVILVNAKANERPEKATAIAQSSLAGGGEAEKGRSTTPLPPSALSEMGDATEEAQRRIEAMQEQQTLLLAQIKQALAALPPPDPKQPSNNPEISAQEEKRRQLIKLLGEIERRINEENARPKKRYISPATREEVYAVYYDSLRHKIEDKGTENFPEAAGRKLYGELTMIATPGRLAASATRCAARPTRSWSSRASSSRATKRLRPSSPAAESARLTPISVWTPIASWATPWNTASRRGFTRALPSSRIRSWCTASA
jgi:protein TonB